MRTRSPHQNHHETSSPKGFHGSSSFLSFLLPFFRNVFIHAAILTLVTMLWGCVPPSKSGSNSPKSNSKSPKNAKSKPAKKPKPPEILIIYAYHHPTLKLDARVWIHSAGKRGCAIRQLVRKYPHKEMSEAKRFCFSQKTWKKLKQTLEAAQVFRKKKRYPCKAKDSPSISLTIQKKGKRVTLKPICGDQKTKLPPELRSLLNQIKAMALTLKNR